jgi:hypothetical protein
MRSGRTAADGDPANAGPPQDRVAPRSQAMRVQLTAEPLSRTDALYYTITVFSTVGFGDITPRADLARIVTMVQMGGVDR